MWACRARACRARACRARDHVEPHLRQRGVAPEANGQRPLGVADRVRDAFEVPALHPLARDRDHVVRDLDLLAQHGLRRRAVRVRDELAHRDALPPVAVVAVVDLFEEEEPEGPLLEDDFALLLPLGPALGGLQRGRPSGGAWVTCWAVCADQLNAAKYRRRRAAPLHGAARLAVRCGTAQHGADHQPRPPSPRRPRLSRSRSPWAWAAP